jgi:hypothetical protein
MNTGLTSLNQAISAVASAKSVLENANTNYDQIYNNYLLKNSGSSAQAIMAQKAVVDGYRLELEKNKLENLKNKAQEEDETQFLID